MEQGKEQESAARQRLRERQQAAEQQLSDVVRRAQESGELRHLYGRPLDLSDDSPDWFLRRALQREGFTHPALERRREVDEMFAPVVEHVDRLRRAYSWLVSPEARPTRTQIEDFNQMRRRDLDEYRVLLRNLNRAIQNYNLGVPDALHRMPMPVEDEVTRLAETVPELEPPSVPRKVPFHQRLLRRLGMRSRRS